MRQRSLPTMAFAGRLAFAQESFERARVEVDTSMASLNAYALTRDQQQDDEDDTLLAAANLLRYATEQIVEAHRILQEGS